MQKIATIFKDFSRTPFDFQGPPTGKVSRRFAYKCTFQVQANRTLVRFQKHANSEVQKPTDVCVFHCRQPSLWTS